MTDTAGALRAGGRGCPSCGAGMQVGDFEHRAEGRVEVELCLDCRALWFDAFESAQLAPRAVIALFRTVQAARDRAERALASVMHCPGCHGVLTLTHDFQNTTRFTYYRCAAGHGRFTPFVQFLREKEFVRSLTPAEIAHLGASVRQVRCTSCGAAIDLANDTACRYCGAPIAILDADAVERAIDRFEAAEQRRRDPAKPDRILEALSGRRMRVPSHYDALPIGFDAGAHDSGALDSIVDLVAGAFDFIDLGDFS
jgi:Zn-finger nucleic acid-binding protein